MHFKFWHRFFLRLVCDVQVAHVPQGCFKHHLQLPQARGNFSFSFSLIRSTAGLSFFLSVA
jgi:hypothetical protein